MNFPPYHNFSACERLERAVKRSNDGGGVPEDILRQHETYHYSIVHKLRSAKYHVDTLRSYLQSDGTSRSSPEEIVYRVNFHFDGFLHALGSSMDIFAREILTYFGQGVVGNIYFHTAHQTLSVARPGDTILPIVNVPLWKQEFNDYRNTATHESLIAAQYNIEVEVRGSVSIQRLRFPIPDDPRAAIKTYNRNTDVVRYCHTTLKRTLSLFNQGYQNVAIRLEGSLTLPL